ncbi:MAG: STN domain-containing protein [Planctomycetota bacterium]
MANFDCLADEPINWKRGTDFINQWESVTGVSWSGNPCRAALRNLAINQRTAIFLDRRIDPEQQLAVQASDITLDELCQRIAQRASMGVCRVGSVIYFGPTSTSQVLATVAAVRRQEIEELKSSQITAERKRKLQSEKPLAWSRLATPRDLIQTLADEAGLRVIKLESHIPHDLWPEAQLPALPWSDRLSLLLAGFEKSFALNLADETIELVSWPNPIQYEKRYAVKGLPAKVVADLADKFGQSALRVDGAQLLVRGPYEDHESIQRVLRGEKVRRNQVGPKQEKRYSLKVENQPLGGVLKAIADTLQVGLEYDPDQVPRLNRRISFEVDMVTLEEILRIALRDSGLKVTQQDGKLKVSDAAP